MVDVGKRFDNLLEKLTEYMDRIHMAQMQIEFYREKGLTAHEIEILNTLESLLKKPETLDHD